MAFHPPKPTPKGLFRRTPPAIFPPILGLLGLSIAWRRGAGEFGLPQGLAEALAGAVALLALFAIVAYLAKFMRRPSVILDDLRILPGRAGIAAAVLCIYLLAGIFAPYSPAEARPILFLGMGVHAAVTAAVLYVFATGPAEQRRVNPVFQLTFTGWIVAATVAIGLGMTTLASILFWISLLSAVSIWVLQMQQLSRETIPAPLRPLLAIHLAPAALLGTVAAGFHSEAIWGTFALLSSVGILALLAGALWLLKAGFSPMWGALTFPLAALANFWLTLGDMWRIPGGIALVAATLIIPPIAIRIFKDWAKGQLAIKTNAATA